MCQTVFHLHSILGIYGKLIYLLCSNRFNRIQRQYENVWVWKDVNIGPHGRYIFNIPVPARPVHWMVSAFSMSPSLGFGMLNKAIEYMGVLPFFINVEMPTMCMQGEQVGIRVTVFNYMMDAMEATVVLLGSPDYKFVHVEENGVVRAYNPRTSFGEHQFFIYIKPQDAVIVYIPIVPTRLGDIDVTVYATTLIGKDQITRRLHVEVRIWIIQIFTYPVCLCLSSPIISSYTFRIFLITFRLHN